MEIRKVGFRVVGMCQCRLFLVNCLDSFRLRVECMKFQHEFAQGYDHLYPALSLLKAAAKGKENL